MTRFARAKGSKASNERVPNEATPWHVMKGQLEDTISMKNHGSSKTKSAKELLAEKDQPYYCDSTGNVNNEWAEFDTSGAKKKSSAENKRTRFGIKSESNEKPSESEVSKVREISEDSFQENSATLNSSKSEERERLCESEPLEKGNSTTGTDDRYNGVDPQNTPKKRKLKTPTKVDLTKETENVGKVETKPKKMKKKKKKNKGETAVSSEAQIQQVSQPTSERIEKSPEEKNSESEKPDKPATVKISKRHKRNQKRINKNALERAAAEEETKDKEQKVATSGGFDAAGNDWSSNVRFGKFGKAEGSKIPNGQAQGRPGNENIRDPPNRFNNRENNGVKRKAPKIRDDKEHKRKKPDVGAIKCVINGQEVEIVKYDGFPVKKEDAERLKDLRQKMVMKGIPKSEIDAAMKLERRKAEKALARMRKQVCFHCRKTGHNLSDCPELGEEESATGICFKCGSTEHTHFECKVTKKEEFRFASCFICREQGHIAKQCPDNPKGLYPQGGACKICGDVTHLKKDCPDLTREKEETALTLGTIAENTLESLDDDSSKTFVVNESKKPKSRIVKF